MVQRNYEVMTVVLPSDEPLRNSLAGCDVRTVLDQSSEKDCARYERLFAASAREAADAGNDPCAALFTLLAAICSFCLRTERPEDAFAPLMVSSIRRTPLPEDLSDLELTTLSSLLDQVSDPELRARIGDVLWVRRRDHKAARLAIASYLAVADSLLSTEDHWPPKAERCERALQLAAALGKQAPEYAATAQHIERYIVARAGTPSFVVRRLMDVLLEQRQGDAKRMSEIAHAQALLAAHDHAWSMAAEYYEAEARWHARLANHDQKRASLVAAAESYASWAAECLGRDRPSHIEAAEHLQQAIMTLRSAGGQAPRIDEVRRQLATVQERVPSELGVIEHEANLGDLADRARAAVRQPRWQDALLRLANVIRPFSVATLRDRINDLTAHYPIQFLMARTKVDVDGRPILRVPPLLNSNPEEREVALFAAMCDQAAMERDLLVTGAIRPARLQVLHDHNIGERELLSITKANPFIPAGHELTYAKGLRAGLVGDFLIASHVLMPSLEASIRGILQANGMITTGLKDNVQQVFSLNTLLCAEQATTVFGADLAGR